MRIGIDARLYSQTGVGRYLQGLLSELEVVDQDNEYYIYLGENDFESFKSENPRWRKRLLWSLWHTFEEQLTVPFYLIRDKLDVVHFPYFNVPIFYPGRYLLTVHDLIIDHFSTGKSSTHSKLFYLLKRASYKIVMTSAVERASFVIAVSQTTKNEIVEHYGKSKEKIYVTYNAVDQNFIKLTKKVKKAKIFNFPYLLFVGNAYPHKNLERLIEAFFIVLKRKKIKLVLVGEDGFFFDRLKRKVKKLNLSNEVIFFGKADNSQLVKLYKNARALIMPSLMEGFGLPILEAVSCGCFSIASDIPVFREIWGESLLYFNPRSCFDMADKISSFLEYEQSAVQQKIKVAQEKTKQFSWRKSAEVTLSLYQKIYENRDCL